MPGVAFFQTFGDVRVARPRRLLIVGEDSADQSEMAPHEPDALVSSVPFGSLSVELLEETAPDIVLSPVVSVSFDCVDVARTLADSEFSGMFRVLTGRLPNPELVTRELSISFPTLDINLVSFDQALVGD